MGEFTLGSGVTKKNVDFSSAPSMGENDLFSSAPSENKVIANVSQKETMASGDKIQQLQNDLSSAFTLVDDIVLKNYLNNLESMEIAPLSEELMNFDEVRLFKITQMVYQNEEYSTYKFASVFNSVQHLNCGLFVIVDSDGEKTEIYMGVRSFDQQRTVNTLRDTLKRALNGQFPGVSTEDILHAKPFLENLSYDNIATVSCVAHNKDDNFNNNDSFIQGLEKLVFSMGGKKYTAMILAKSTQKERLLEMRAAYEEIYTNLSPMAQVQLTYSTNHSTNQSTSYSEGTQYSMTNNRSKSWSRSHTHSENTSTSESSNSPGSSTSIGKGAALALLHAASLATAPMTGGASIAVATGLSIGNLLVNTIPDEPSSPNENTSSGTSKTTQNGGSHGQSETNGTNQSNTSTTGDSSGFSETFQTTKTNKNIQNILQQIDNQLERLNDCESLGMWECATYFMSSSHETCEMAAGTYKALMNGENTGVESSAINIWGTNSKKIEPLKEYLTHLIHPEFIYSMKGQATAVTPSSFLSGNELALHMGLPRKSTYGFPVLKYVQFAHEVINFHQSKVEKTISLGQVFNMGVTHKNQVPLAQDSLTSHTLITGSTGSGKSNTIYTLLDKLAKDKKKFLVIEPTKGEYKNVFGTRTDLDVAVYGTNPKLSPLLRINPFKFHEDIHILEHLDRLVDIFNVCWPMYAAMPAILKEAMERAYVEAGWDLKTSTNKIHENLFPNFTDVLEQISMVLNDSAYSKDNKGDYIGALSTRLRSLTNGINGMIFTQNDLSDEELFEKNVVVDLSRVGSMETKALIMGLLVMKLSEYYMVSEYENAALHHVTVLEEAHNLLKRTSTEQSSESSNLLGKSVEMLSNAIAEMRTYGEGFIIADQSPNMLDMSAIRNTNTKIIMKLPDEADRELVGKSANLSDEQIVELSRLKTGVAAVYQNNWLEPVLCQVDEYQIEQKKFKQPESISSEENMDESLLQFIVKKGNIENVDQFREMVISSYLKASVKASVLMCLRVSDKKETLNLLQQVAYRFFDGQTVIKPSGNKSDMGDWIKAVVEQLSPTITHLSSDQIQEILIHLVYEHEKLNGSSELTTNFAEYVNVKGGAYRG